MQQQRLQALVVELSQLAGAAMGAVLSAEAMLWCCRGCALLLASRSQAGSSCMQTSRFAITSNI